jgi:hypothetical protein
MKNQATIDKILSTRQSPKLLKRYYTGYSQLYIINLFNAEENFLKIGSSFFCLNRRFSSKKIMPYEYKIICQIVTKEYNNLESIFQNNLSKFKYDPKIKFGGYSECFTNESLNSNFLSRILKEVHNVSE